MGGFRLEEPSYPEHPSRPSALPVYVLVALLLSVSVFGFFRSALLRDPETELVGNVVALVERQAKDDFPLDRLHILQAEWVPELEQYRIRCELEHPDGSTTLVVYWCSDVLCETPDRKTERTP